MKEIKAIIKGNLLSNKKKALGLIGPAGVGKSDIIKELAEELNRPIVELRASYKTPGDLIGVPFAENVIAENGEIIDQVTAFLKPKWLRQLQESPNAIFVLEEISNASTDVQGALYEVLLDWAINNVQIPKTVNILFTGNRSEDAIGIAIDLQSTIYTRATIIQLSNEDINFDDWKEWALKNEIHPSILSYIDINRQSLLHPMRENSSYCTPRTWAILSQDLKDNEYLLKTGIEEDKIMWEKVVNRIILSVIPEENQFSYYYLDGMKLEKPEVYIKNPNKYNRDEEMFMQISYNLAYYISKNPNKVSNEWIVFFQNLADREGLRELPILISILNSIDLKWNKKIQEVNLDLGFKIGDLILDKIKLIKEIQNGSF